jgi:hypothetical protein
MLAYCDKIASVIHKSLLDYDSDGIIGPVGQIEWDLHPEEGYFMSTKKTIEVSDTNGKTYRVTVEEVK